MGEIKKKCACSIDDHEKRICFDSIQLLSLDSKGYGLKNILRFGLLNLTIISFFLSLGIEIPTSSDAFDGASSLDDFDIMKLNGGYNVHYPANHIAFDVHQPISNPITYHVTTHKGGHVIHHLHHYYNKDPDQKSVNHISRQLF